MFFPSVRALSLSVVQQPGDCSCCGMGAVNYWSKWLNRGQDPLWLQRGCGGERQRPGKLFLPSGDRGEAGKEKGRTAVDRKAPIGGQSLRVRGSIWKATLCRALYCTPCCFNQWQACSQSLEQQWLPTIVSLLPKLFLLHYAAALLTESLKHSAALPGSLWKYLLFVVRHTNCLSGNDDLIRAFFGSCLHISNFPGKRDRRVYACCVGAVS